MNCRVCSGELYRVLDLGQQLLPDFTDPGTPPPPAYPLRLALCEHCTLLQLEYTTPRTALYHERYGFKSGVNEAIRNDLAGVVKYAASHAAILDGNWLDIACNDGTLLSYVPDTFARYGIDPLAQLAGEASQHGEIISDYFSYAYFNHGQFDVITSVSMFYDLDDPHRFTAEVAHVLAGNGVWVIQQNYALDMIQRNAVDNICHEHVTYFTVTALVLLLAAHGLEINDVTYSDVNGGCVRTLASHIGARPVSPRVSQAVVREREAGLGSRVTWRDWGHAVTRELGKTLAFVQDAVADGRSVWLYGASTRGGTLLQMIGAGPELLPYAVERNPVKVGKVMAATGIPIVSEAAMRAARPDYLLVTPWFFRDVFTDRERPYLEAGGVMIFPLPRFETVEIRRIS